MGATLDRAGRGRLTGLVEPFVRIAPSVLSADFARLGEEVRRVEEAGADEIHVDVMDGRFVPNITVGVPVVASLARIARRPLDVHLMIEAPERDVEAFAQAGARTITVHVETSPHLHRTLAAIRAAGCRAGVALDPHTPPDFLPWVLEQLDRVLVMTVEPGFGGQRFIEAMLPKIEQVRTMIDRAGAAVDVEVDGGIRPGVAARVVSAGARVLVAGSAVFGQADYAAAIAALREDGS